MDKKYCTIYLVRHGKTDWNEKKLIQGHSDIPLNPEGEQQAQTLAKELRDIKFDKVYSSDLVRAKHTAEIITEHKQPVETVKDLRERKYAHMEGKDKSVLKEIDNALLLLNEEEQLTYKHHPEIESNKEIADRFLTFLMKIAASNSRKKVLVVSHGGPMWVLLSLLEKIDTNKHIIKIHNTAYIKLESDGVNLFIREKKGIKVE